MHTTRRRKQHLNADCLDAKCSVAVYCVYIMHPKVNYCGHFCSNQVTTKCELDIQSVDELHINLFSYGEGHVYSIPDDHSLFCFSVLLSTRSAEWTGGPVCIVSCRLIYLEMESDVLDSTSACLLCIIHCWCFFNDTTAKCF